LAAITYLLLFVIFVKQHPIQHGQQAAIKMKTCIFLWTISLLFLSSVKGFAPLSPAVKNNPCRQQRGRSRTSAACSSTLLSLSQDPNQQEGGDGESSSKATVEDDELDDYDFEAGFQARLKKEGGATGVQVKTAAKQSVDSVTRGAKRSVDSVTQGVTETGNILGLLSKSEWGMTVGVLALVVVLAIGTHFASPAPFETTSNGEQLTFGVR
jgi:hypothetical protein